MLLSEDNAVQLAMKHTDEAIREADRRAAMLEDWYRRTYSPAEPGDRKGRVNVQECPRRLLKASKRTTRPSRSPSAGSTIGIKRTSLLSASAARYSPLRSEERRVG